jgi:hypothetical protein
MKALISALLMLVIAVISSAQNVNIPDINFKNALIEWGIDTSGDGEISYAEAEARSDLYFYQEITDFTGIEAFINLDSLTITGTLATSLDVSACTKLKYLSCWLNQLDSIDVSGCASLEYLLCFANYIDELDISNNIMLQWLICSANELTSLDVSNNTALTRLICGETQIVSLDISNNICLTYLDCSNNPMESLDVSSNTSLSYLNCSFSHLTSLDVSACDELTELDCRNNELTSLDVTNNTSLTLLDCRNNQLTSLVVPENDVLKYLYANENQLTGLDISNNTALSILSCFSNELTSLNVAGCIALEALACSDNELTRLDISDNTALKQINLSNMPTLYKVCVWETFLPLGVYIYTDGSPNVYFTTDCTDNSTDDYSADKQIRIYPNPSDGIITIEIKNEGNALMEIYNLNGTQMLSKVFNSKIEKIDISDFEPGIYLLKVIHRDIAVINRIAIM